MNASYPKLERRLQQALRAWQRSRWQRGLGLALAGLLVMLVFVYLVEPSSPIWWWAALLVMASGWFTVITKYLILPLRARPTLRQIARFLEEQHPELEDRLATAVEFGEPRLTAGEPHWLDRLIGEAISHTASINFTEQLQLRAARGWQVLAALAAMICVILITKYALPFRTKVAGYLEKRDETTQVVNRLRITPGNAKVARGETVEVAAFTPHLELAAATLYLESSRDSWQPNSMSLATTPGHFTHQVFDIRDTLRYYVRAGDELSPIFTLVPLDAPEVKSFRMRYRYPAGMGLPPKRESGSGDIYAPVGTAVDLELLATQPLQRAEIRLGDTNFQEMKLPADTLAQHAFIVERDSYYVLRLTNRDNLSNAPMEYFIHAMPDQAPQIILLRPARDLRPTMLEEVPLEVEVREDYALRQLDLVYVRNNGEPVRQNLLPRATRSAMGDYKVELLLYLEDQGVQIGDFISYYFEAADATQPSSSDLYFLEVRPFIEEFYRALSSGSGNSPAASLALSEKEIITATWKLEQTRERFSTEALQSSSTALAETQESLRASIQQMAAHAKIRAQYVDEGPAANLVQYLEQATAAMREAVPLLADSRLQEALDPERRAYHALLQAEAAIRRRELTQSTNASGSFSQLQNRDELQRLFKDELEKIQSKYETFENNRQRQRETRLNEAQEKVRELAQRQERLVELNRRLARENNNEENRRQIERLRREQEQLNREVQQLGQNMDPASGSASSANSQENQQALRQALEEMQRAHDSLRRDNPARAAAEGGRALEQLNRLSEQLQREQNGSWREQLAQWQNELQHLREAQNQLREETLQQSAGGAPLTSPWQERQENLRQRTERLQEKLSQAQAAPRGAGAVNDAPSDLTRALNEMNNRKTVQRMTEAARALEQKDLSRAAELQKEAERGLQQAELALQESLSRLAETPEEKLQTALQETQRLRERLEGSLRQARQGQNSSPEARPGAPASEAGRQPGQTPGGTGESPAGGEGLNPGNMNRWNENLWSEARQLEQLQSFMKGDSALGRNYRDLIKGYRGVLQSFRGGDPLRVEQIEQQLLDPLRRFEAELATRLAALQQRERLLSVRDEQVPPQYRELVQEYFKRLAQNKK